MREALVVRHYSPKTVEAYVGWMRRFVLFHERRHSATMGSTEVAKFLSELATRRSVSASTQNQALAGLLFLYHEVLQCELDPLRDVVPAKRPGLTCRHDTR